MQTNPLALLYKNAQEYGNFIYYPLGILNVFLINHPDAIQHILQLNHRNYSKDTFQYNLLSSITGNGLLTSNGEFWLRQRRLVQPAFHRNRIITFGPLITDTTQSMLTRWESLSRTGQQLDVDAEMMQLTLAIVGKALFSIDLTDQATELTRATLTVLDYIVHRARHPISLPPGFPTSRNRQFRSALNQLDHAVFSIINHRRQAGKDTRTSSSERSDLLDLLLDARDEQSGAGMTDRQLRDEVITLLIAGHETVASALIWTWYLLSQNPSAADRLRAELAKVLGEHVPTAEDLPNLPYTRMVFEETLRLYPPAWMISRKTLGEDTIVCGETYSIPANALVIMSPYIIQRHPDYWESPELFDPLRFTPERIPNRPHFVYIPFGGGPRLCIGDSFARFEAQLIIACIAQRFRLDLLGDPVVTAEPLVTLRPKHGLSMCISPNCG
jgi:cytochrome P450